MKTKSYFLTAALSAAALVIIPNVAQAGGHGGARASMNIGASRSFTAGRQMNFGRAGLDDRAGHNANDDRGRGRGRGKDDPRRHDLRDGRGVMRPAGSDDPAGHDKGDDRNRRHRRGRGN